VTASLGSGVIAPTSGSIPDRVAAYLVLLYAQPAARIATLTREHIHTTTHDSVTLHLGATAIAIPPPLDAMLTQLPLHGPKGAAAHLHQADWLFPGRRAGHHLHPPASPADSGHSGSTRARTTTPPSSNSPPRSPPQCSPTSSASTS
jgi:hypothetical protein